MTEYRLQMRCPGCGALNRVRLVSGKRVRVRCGNCGEALPVNTGRLLLLAAGQWLKGFFGHSLPLFLLALTDLFLRILGVLAGPFRYLWRRLPEGVRLRLAWATLIIIVLADLWVEGTVKLGFMLLMLGVLAAASLIMLLSTRGPGAVVGLGQSFTGRFIRRCPGCGHRYFGWLKHCPRCGRPG